MLFHSLHTNYILPSKLIAMNGTVLVPRLGDFIADSLNNLTPTILNRSVGLQL
jgi:hypothetical protein